MKIVRSLCSLALHQLLGDRARPLLDFFGNQFGDQSQRVLAALYVANQRSWKSVELTLAGDSWWQRCKNVLTARDEQAFRGQIESFLQTAPAVQWTEKKNDFRKRCYQEMKAAQKAGIIPGDQPTPAMIAERVSQFVHYTDPSQVIQAEVSSLEELSDELKKTGFNNLAEFVALRPDGGQPLLVIAVRFFFRREVENDPKLAAGLTFQQLETLTTAQQAGFQSLHEALASQGARLEQLLLSVQEVVEETREAVVETRDEVRDMRDELREQNEQLRDEVQELYKAVQQLLERQQTPVVVHVPVPQPAPAPTHQPAPAPAAAVAPPTPSLEIPQEPVPATTAKPLPQPVGTQITPTPAATADEPASEWEQVRNLLARCRALPKEQQRQMPALFRSLGKLKANARHDVEPPKPALKQLRGRIVNEKLFKVAQTQETTTSESPPEEATPPAAEKKKHKLVSSIFFQNQNKPKE